MPGDTSNSVPLAKGGQGSALLASAVEFGAELRRLRICAGLTLKDLVHELGLSAHSNLSDYERGRRTPHVDLVVRCEAVLEVADGQLVRLLRLVHEERANLAAQQLRARAAL